MISLESVRPHHAWIAAAVMGASEGAMASVLVFAIHGVMPILTRVTAMSLYVSVSGSHVMPSSLSALEQSVLSILP